MISFNFLDIFRYGDKLEKKLLLNHIIALFLLLSMVSIAYVILTSIITMQNDSSLLVNSCGKQRMYTQKVLYLVSSFSVKNENDYLKKSISEELGLLQLNNNYLIAKLNDKTSVSFQNKEVINLFQKKNGINDKYLQFKNSIQIYIINKEEKNLLKIEEYGKELLSLYDDTTQTYQDMSELKIKKLLFYEKIIFIISLIIIILEGLFIFRPAIFEVYIKHSKLKNLNKNLNKEVKLQVETLREQEQMMIQQAKLAEMGDMLSDISHQWKQPLTILSMQLENMQLDMEDMGIKNDLINEYFIESFALIKHMSTTVEDFKNFYRQDTEKRTFNIYKAIEDVVNIEKSIFYKYTIKNEIISDITDTEFFGFYGQFKQVVLSLTNNAIDQIIEKYEEGNLQKGEGKISFTIIKKANTISITISDNAGGIEKSILSKIFIPYFTTKEKKGGSGIGLYMAKTIIEKNFNGMLSVKNNQFGADFRITLDTVED